MTGELTEEIAPGLNFFCSVCQVGFERKRSIECDAEVLWVRFMFDESVVESHVKLLIC